MESLIKNARDLLKKLQPIKQAFSTAGQNLGAWGQVATQPNLRQSYTQNVIQPKVKQFTQASRKPYQAVYGNFINQSNTPVQWLGRVAQDVKQRGWQEAPHDLTYPITKSPLVEPWLEPLLSKVRVANYKANRPSSTLNFLLGQTDKQMVNPAQRTTPTIEEKFKQILRQQFKNNPLAKPINTIGKKVLQDYLFNPQTKQVLPQSPYWSLAEINKIDQSTPEGKKLALQKMNELGNQVMIGMMGGGKVKAKTTPLSKLVGESRGVAQQATKGVGGVVEGGVSGKLPQQVGQISTKAQEVSIPKVEAQIIRGGGQLNIPGSPSQAIIPQLGVGNPVARITEALKGAKPLRGEQEAIYSQIRSRQAGALKGIGEQLGGEAGYYQKLGKLKGELPKVNFESIKKQVSQTDIDYVFNQVEKSNITVWEKVNAQTALRKLLGEKGGTIPTNRELDLLSEIFPKDFIQAVLDNRTTFQKLMSGTGQVLNLPRAVMASADLSAPLRQGVFFIGRPKQFIPAFRDMFKYAFNEKSYKGLMEGVKVRPNYKLMREAKLSLTDMGPQLTGREEAFMSNLAEKIPGFGPIARGSNRAYSGFLNKLRADVFDDLIKSARTQGIKVEGKVLRDIGSFINSATGRGQLPGGIEKSAVALNSVFFSPRLMASRVNLLNPIYYAKLDPFVRKEALKSLLTFGATATSILGLAKLGGAGVGFDPRNADFGKIKVGNTRYDILGGFQQYIRLAAQLISGKIVSSTTRRVITLGEGYKSLTRKDILARFFEYKTSPVASFVIAMATGKNALGEDFNLPAEVANRFIPMVIQDIYDLAKEKDSIGQALVMGSPAIFGTGVQTYGKQELVYGESQLGQPTSQIRPIQGPGEKIAEKVFGQKPLGTSKSFNVDAYYDQLLKMPKEQAAKQFDLIAKTNPDLAKKIIDVVKERQKGITVEDKSLKQKGVASGDRAIAISKEFNKLKTKEEKAALWDEYVKKGIITKEVAQQLNQLLKGGR